MRADVPTPCRVCNDRQKQGECRVPAAPCARSLRSAPLAPLRLLRSRGPPPPPPPPASSVRLCPCPTCVSCYPPPGSGDPRHIYVYLQTQTSITIPLTNAFTQCLHYIWWKLKHPRLEKIGIGIGIGTYTCRKYLFWTNFVRETGSFSILLTQALLETCILRGHKKLCVGVDYNFIQLFTYCESSKLWTYKWLKNLTRVLKKISNVLQDIADSKILPYRFQSTQVRKQMSIPLTKRIQKPPEQKDIVAPSFQKIRGIKWKPFC